MYLSGLDGLIIRPLEMNLFTSIDETFLIIHWSGYGQSGGRSHSSSKSLASAPGGRRAREARKDALELLAKVVIEPGVEEDVVAGR